MQGFSYNVKRMIGFFFEEHHLSFDEQRNYLHIQPSEINILFRKKPTFSLNFTYQIYLPAPFLLYFGPVVTTTGFENQSVLKMRSLHQPTRNKNLCMKLK